MSEENGSENENLPAPPIKMIVEIGQNSPVERQIHHVLQKHFLDQRTIAWKPFAVELIVNTSLTEEFLAIKKRFEKASAGNRSEFDEHFAFLVEPEEQIVEIAANGYQTAETSFNVLGHSKSGVYVCRYADVCLRHAAARRTSEDATPMKMLVFKIVEGKQTAALVRKGPKLQPIGPTPNFTSHCSVITPKEGDELEKQFDQSQIFLYEFEGRETVKRPHHCLPYAIVTFVQDESEWPTTFDDPGVESETLDADTLRLIGRAADDPLLQTTLKENVELAEAATRALERTFEEEAPVAPISETAASPPAHLEPHSSTMTENGSTPPMPNGLGSAASPTSTSEHPSSSSPSADVLPPPPPPPSSSSTSSTSSTSLTPIPTAKTPATAVATTIPLAHTAAAVQAAYRQQNSLLGALPTVAALRTAPGPVYATPAGLASSLTGPILYGGIPMDALRGYSAGAAAGTSPFVFATHAGQTIQQPALYAAQLQAVAQQQQQQAAAQLAAVQQQQQQLQQQQQQQQQHQSLINGIPAGCMLVRTATGGYALLAQSPNATTSAALQAQAQAQPALAQQQYIAVNANGQATAANGRMSMAMFAGPGGQQMMYQYAGQPTIQAGPTQYIQLQNNAGQVQQQHPLSTSPVLQTAVYPSQTATQYLNATQAAGGNPAGSTSTNGHNTIGPSPTNASQIQPTSTIISPQKQSAATATAAAMQQQQQYQHVLSAQQQHQQQQQQQSANGAHGAGVYYAAINQAQAQLNAQMQAQQAAFALAHQQQQQQQQQQQMNFMSQFQYAAQAGVPQAMYYTSPGGQTIYQAGGQSYVLAQAAPTVGGTTTTGSPAIYSAGPALHSATSAQQNQAAYQMLSAAANGNVSAGAGAGVVAQQPPQLVQRSSVLPQVRHHPYRN